MYNDSRIHEFQTIGLVASFLAHFSLLLIVFLRFGTGWGDFQEPVVYSITIEGGKRLGGLAQVPEKDQKSPIAPPKKTSAEDKSKEQSKVEPDKKADESKLPVADKGEVQVKAKDTKEKDQKKKEEKKDTKKKDSQADLNKQYQEAMQRYLGESSKGGGTGFGAAKLGGNGMGGGVVRPPEFFVYMKQLEDHIKSGWIWSDTNAALISQVVFDMAPDGKISGTRISRSSGNSSYDDSVLRAIAKASPAPIPPASVYQFFAQVRMTFDPRE